MFAHPCCVHYKSRRRRACQKCGWAAAQAENCSHSWPAVRHLLHQGHTSVYTAHCLVSEWALHGYFYKVRGRMRKKEGSQTGSACPGSSHLTQLFFSSPTEKEATEFFPRGNGCGQVLVIFALWWMKKRQRELWPDKARYCYAEDLHENLHVILKGELHFQCTEVSLYSKIMLFLKQVAKCKYCVGICLFLKKHLHNYRAI